MQIQSFNAELAMANLMFLRLFNNIVIQHTSNNNITTDIKVNCQLGQRSRVFKNWYNAEKRAEMKLPMIVVNRTGYSRNGDRLNNMHNEVKYEMTSKYRKYELLTPIPIDISYDVSILSKNVSDIDQIASNFMVFFNPDVYVTCEHPKYEGIKLNNQIIMSDNVTEEHPDELDSSADDFVSTTFQFTFKTYLFGGTQQAKKLPQYILSAYTSAVMSSYIYELNDEDKQHLSDFLDCSLSTTMQKKVIAELSTYVQNTNTSDYVYDGFTPIVKNIDIGFYPVPQLCDYVPYMDKVDAKDPNWMYADKIKWAIDEASDKPFPDNVNSITP